MNKLKLTAVVLTFNEELHLDRCLNSISQVCSEIIIVDSYSNDTTHDIAEKYNVKFYQNSWVNYATQLNWSLNNTNITSDWILRIDADEYLSQELIKSLKNISPKLDPSATGITINRLMYFMGKPLKYGGMYPISHLRIWKKGFGKCEQRWMDERIILSSGSTLHINGDLIDNNLNNLSWWTNKHNNYSTREAIDLLNYKHQFFKSNELDINYKNNGLVRRKLKKIYNWLPLFVRPIMFFLVRYFFQFGFLDGKRGLIWTFLQCFWYRFLVDAKIHEANIKSNKKKENLIKYFKVNYNYDITKSS